MTPALLEAITAYAKRPSTIRLELGMALIRDGALKPREERRLREVLNERHEQKGKR
jgi:hypothetical protein